MATALLEHLARRPRLVVLELPGSIGGASLQADLHMQVTGTIFADLRQLQIVLASRPVHLMLCGAPAVKQLYLIIFDSEVRGLSALTPLTELTALSLATLT